MIGLAADCIDLRRYDMRKTLKVVLSCSVLLLSCQLSYAQEDYAECKARCAQLYTDCVNEPPAEDPEVQAAKEGSCNQKTELCNSDCENRKPVLDTIEPESNPNVIRK
jgi:hypothetical protein